MSSVFYFHEDKTNEVPFWDPTEHTKSKPGFRSDVIDVKTKLTQSVILTLEHPSPVGDVNVEISEGDIVKFITNMPYPYTPDVKDNIYYPGTFVHEGVVISGMVTKIKRIRVNSEDHVCFTIQNVSKTINVLAESIRSASVISRGTSDSMYQVYCNITDDELNAYEDSDDPIAIMVDIFGLKYHHHYSSCLHRDSFDSDIRKYVFINESYFNVPKTLSSDIYTVKLRFFNSDSELEPYELGRIFVDAENGLFIPQSIINKQRFYMTGVNDSRYLNNLRNIAISRSDDVLHPYDNIRINTSNLGKDVIGVPTFEIESNLYKSSFPMNIVPNNAVIMFYNIPYNNIFKFNSNVKTWDINSNNLHPNSKFMLSTCYSEIHNNLFNAIRYSPIKNPFYYKDENLAVVNTFIDLSHFMNDHHSKKLANIHITIERTVSHSIISPKKEIVLDQKIKVHQDMPYKKGKSCYHKLNGVVFPNVDTSTIYHVTIIRNRYIEGSIGSDVIPLDKFEYDLQLSNNTIRSLGNVDVKDISFGMYGMYKALYTCIPKGTCNYEVFFNSDAYTIADKFYVRDKDGKEDQIMFVALYLDKKETEYNILARRIDFISPGNHKLIGIDPEENSYTYDLEIDENGNDNFNSYSCFIKDEPETPKYDKVGLKVYFAFPDGMDLTHASFKCSFSIINKSNNTSGESDIRSLMTDKLYPQFINIDESSVFGSQMRIPNFINDTLDITKFDKFPEDLNDKFINIEVVATDRKDTERLYTMNKITVDILNSIECTAEYRDNTKFYSIIILVGDKHLSSYAAVIKEISTKSFNGRDIQNIIFDVLKDKLNKADGIDDKITE